MTETQHAGTPEAGSPLGRAAVPLEAGGQRTRVLDVGHGPPVVVLHGWGGRIESMAPVIACLRRDFRVVALDLPGFGDAPLPAAVWGTLEYARFVADVMGELAVERPHVVGHSFGAKTALCLAAAHPALVSKLVLVSSPGIRTPPSRRAWARRRLSAFGRRLGGLGPLGRAARSFVYRRVASSDYEEAGALRPVLVRVVNEDLLPLLGRVECPTLLVWGTEDDAVPVAHARIMESAIPDAGLVLFQGAAHFPYLEHPERFCRIVRHFFAT